ncbi:hypothetical protein BDW68DRAFT_162472 [Aspergillus falconensis]
MSLATVAAETLPIVSAGNQAITTSWSPIIRECTSLESCGSTAGRRDSFHPVWQWRSPTQFLVKRRSSRRCHRRGQTLDEVR